MIKISIKIEVNPTEDPEKIVGTLNNFTNIKQEDIVIDKISEGYFLYSVTANGRSALQSMFDRLRSQQIVESARKHLINKSREDSVSFMLNKQALYVNRFHFCHSPDESPMGPVWVKIESDNIIRLLEYLVPHTIKGHPQEVNYLPE